MTSRLTRRGFVTVCTTALAGCSVLPEEKEPIEASATAPAVLPASTEYSLVVEESLTIETTVTVEFSGDVEITSRRDVTATIYQRVYEGETSSRLGLLTAPAVQVIDQPEVRRDPLTAVDDARVVELAIDEDVDAVSTWQKETIVMMLGTETSQMAATATVDGRERDIARARVRADGDSVTAMITDPDNAAPVLQAVTRDASLPR